MDGSPWQDLGVGDWGATLAGQVGAKEGRGVRVLPFRRGRKVGWGREGPSPSRESKWPYMEDTQEKGLAPSCDTTRERGL